MNPGFRSSEPHKKAIFASVVSRGQIVMSCPLPTAPAQSCNASGGG